MPTLPRLLVWWTTTPLRISSFLDMAANMDLRSFAMPLQYPRYLTKKERPPESDLVPNPGPDLDKPDIPTKREKLPRSFLDMAANMELQSLALPLPDQGIPTRQLPI